MPYNLKQLQHDYRTTTPINYVYKILSNEDLFTVLVLCFCYFVSVFIHNRNALKSQSTKLWSFHFWLWKCTSCAMWYLFFFIPTKFPICVYKSECFYNIVAFAYLYKHQCVLTMYTGCSFIKSLSHLHLISFILYLSYTFVFFVNL